MTRARATGTDGGRIAVVGWGSLIWDLDDLAPKVQGGWRMNAGPRLPLEFSRISAKRLQALVAIIDPDHGVPCPSHAILSARTDLGEARADLAARERAPLQRIGAVSAEDRPEGEISRLFTDWCRQEGLDGAVWTDLARNFETETGAPFSLERGLAYLRALEGASATEAARYISEAPAGTDTPLRRTLAGEPWWRARVAGLG